MDIIVSERIKLSSKHKRNSVRDSCVILGLALRQHKVYFGQLRHRGLERAIMTFNRVQISVLRSADAMHQVHQAFAVHGTKMKPDEAT